MKRESTSSQRTIAIRLASGFAALAAIVMAGCAGNVSTPGAPGTVAISALSGTVHGGQQPISGATMHLYAAGTSGYSGTNTDLLKNAVTTDGNGNFSISGDYSCTAGQQMYLVAVGGNPGAGLNPQAAIMAALGDCNTLIGNTNILMNEVTTVGSVFALAPFMSGYAAVGSSASNSAGLARAFASVKKLTDYTTGTAPGPALPAGATAPTDEIYALADILAACVNSIGGFAGDGTTTCGTLFSLATPNGGTPPTETVGLALAIAKNPALNVAALYGYASGQTAFAQHLSGAPNDWTISINYTGGSFSTPQSTTIDANGRVWVANAGNNTVSVLAQTGAVAMGPLSSNGLNGPDAIAIDGNGYAWMANSGGSSVSAFTSSGTGMNGSPFPTGTAPHALAVDVSGNVWVANGGSTNLSELNSAGATVATIPTTAAPAAIAIDPH